jgi:hypothetical protein
MLRRVSLVAAVAAVLFAPAAASAGQPHNHQAYKKQAYKQQTYKHRHAGKWRGYGFLPGYSPERVARRLDRQVGWSGDDGYYWSGYWAGAPWWWRGGYYRGHFIGNGLGPCWKSTPIGLMWICG